MNPAVGSGDRDLDAAVSLLCLRWRERSLAAGWSVWSDWWVPAVDAVTRAACAGLDLAGPCAALAAARARGGVGVGETLDDVGALHAALGMRQPAMPVVRAVAEGWTDATTSAVADLADPVCADPLTGLTTLAYLRTRVGELYRAPRPPRYALVLVDLVGGEPVDGGPGPAVRWRRLVRVIVVGRFLRAAFRGGETLSLLGACRVTVLVVDRPGLDRAVVTLRTTLAARHGARVWVTRLPDRIDQAIRLLGELADGSPGRAP